MMHYYVGFIAVLRWSIEFQHALYQNDYTQEAWYRAILKEAAPEAGEPTRDVYFQTIDIR